MLQKGENSTIHVSFLKKRCESGKFLLFSNPGDVSGTEAHLEWRLQVVFVALGKELIRVGCRSVLVEVLQVLQVRSEVLLSVAADSCENKLCLQLGEKNHKQTNKKKRRVMLFAIHHCD